MTPTTKIVLITYCSELQCDSSGPHTVKDGHVSGRARPLTNFSRAGAGPVCISAEGRMCHSQVNAEPSILFVP